MGNEISTLGGAVATATTAVAAGVTLGQVDAINDAVVGSVTYTAERAEQTVVRHVGETVAMAAATVGTSIASGVTLGQVQSLNNAVVHCAVKTVRASEQAGAGLLDLADSMTDGLPVVGHVKGGIYCAIGDRLRSDRALKSASRSLSVLAGGIKGYLVGGPVGAVVGGIVGGAAIDSTITGVESALHSEFRPHGQIACWDQATSAANSAQRIDGIVGGVLTSVADALAGFAAGKAVHALHGPPPSAAVVNLKVPADDASLSVTSAFKRWTSVGSSGNAPPSMQTSDGLIQRALDGLGGLVTGGETVEALVETASTPESKDAIERLWSGAVARVCEAFAPTDNTNNGQLRSYATTTVEAKDTAAPKQLLGHAGMFKGKDLVVLLFVVYVALSAIALGVKER